MIIISLPDIIDLVDEYAQAHTFNPYAYCCYL